MDERGDEEMGGGGRGEGKGKDYKIQTGVAFTSSKQCFTFTYFGDREQKNRERKQRWNGNEHVEKPLFCISFSACYGRRCCRVEDCRRSEIEKHNF